mmetsp:Transcript_2220/g.3574  ORF Transcript_2220/g.3574 Transcript_2220/m.3574 type:complete len:156 (+) Transcript_2220:39-506(+)
MQVHHTNSEMEDLINQLGSELGALTLDSKTPSAVSTPVDANNQPPPPSPVAASHDVDDSDVDWASMLDMDLYPEDSACEIGTGAPEASNFVASSSVDVLEQTPGLLASDGTEIGVGGAVLDHTDFENPNCRAELEQMIAGVAEPMLGDPLEPFEI